MITVVGEALVDIVHPAGGEPVAHPGGSPANVAVGLGRLGAPVRLVTSFGRDAYGRLLAKHLAASSVAVAPQSVHDGSTSVARARVGASGVASYEFDITWDLGAAVTAAAAADSLCLHTGSIAATLAPGAFAVGTLIERARGRMTVSYDPNCRPSLMGDPASARGRVEALVALADVVKVSEEDLAWLHPARDVTDIAADWLASGPAVVVVTRGAQGSYAVCRAGSVTAPAVPVTVADTIGAGDAFTSGLLNALYRRALLGAADLASRLDTGLLDDLLTEAALISALTCARPGADPPTAAELRALLVTGGRAETWAWSQGLDRLFRPDDLPA
ncbi:carbohydrate kinase family protein [Yinghuangia seranimata]|uniref:carbohydrate kinase family protein n=1 Tax=Yinghuangia seranimata TaxID=408067 RepID=UPI00248B880F|nr:carbohydrate kinase [Yinghuangia seranimata]MDI2129499.1 carbohydrate kinase [Yinghuangia seranimata]